MMMAFARHCTVVLIIAALGSVGPEGVRAQAGSTSTLISAEQLQKDFIIMKQAYEGLHPALYRYTDKATMDAHFEALERRLQKDMTLPEAYLAFSWFLAKVKCGHTYANFWNQTDDVKQAVFWNADKLPFTFRLIDRRMIVTQNASDQEQIVPGTEILAINGVPVPAILDSLITVVKADGSNDAKRLHDLQVTGLGDFEAFDIYYPLFFPVEAQTFELEARDLVSGTDFAFTTAALTRSARRTALEGRYGPQPTTYDDLWRFEVLDERMVYLQIGTFVTWNMELDWKAFLDAAFEEIEQKQIPNLILDIRGNEGGADEVNAFLSRYLVTKPIALEGRRQRLRYRTTPPELDPYLDTWDDSFRDRGDRVEAVGDGFYTWRNASPQARTVEPRKEAYQGRVYVLVDAANSSATFNLASVLKQHKLATLVGQETGGNRRGITGGQFFFLRLPHSKLEMDIPLIAGYPLTEQSDEGLAPDVYVPPRVEDIINGVDTELEAVKALIARKP